MKQLVLSLLLFSPFAFAYDFKVSDVIAPDMHQNYREDLFLVPISNQETPTSYVFRQRSNIGYPLQEITLNDANEITYVARQLDNPLFFNDFSSCRNTAEILSNKKGIGYPSFAVKKSFDIQKPLKNNLTHWNILENITPKAYTFLNNSLNHHPKNSLISYRLKNEQEKKKTIERFEKNIGFPLLHMQWFQCDQQVIDKVKKFTLTEYQKRIQFNEDISSIYVKQHTPNKPMKSVEHQELFGINLGDKKEHLKITSIIDKKKEIYQVNVPLPLSEVKGNYQVRLNKGKVTNIKLISEDISLSACLERLQIASNTYSLNYKTSQRLLNNLSSYKNHFYNEQEHINNPNFYAQCFSDNPHKNYWFILNLSKY